MTPQPVLVAVPPAPQVRTVSPASAEFAALTAMARPF